MTASLDREQILLDRLSREIPAFRARMESCLVSLADLEAHRQVVIDSLELIDEGNAPELATMRDQLALYGLELVALQLQVHEDAERVTEIMS